MVPLQHNLLLLELLSAYGVAAGVNGAGSGANRLVRHAHVDRAIHLGRAVRRVHSLHFSDPHRWICLRCVVIRI